MIRLSQFWWISRLTRNLRIVKISKLYFIWVWSIIWATLNLDSDGKCECVCVSVCQGWHVVFLKPFARNEMDLPLDSFFCPFLYVVKNILWVDFQNFKRRRRQIPAENSIVCQFQNCPGNRPGRRFPYPNEHFRLKCRYFRFRPTSATIHSEARSRRRAASPWRLSARRPVREPIPLKNRISEITWITKPRPRTTKTKDWSLNRYFQPLDLLRKFRKQISFKFF